MAGSGLALHRTIVVVDVESFGDPQRTLPHQLGTRAGLYQVIVQALRAAGAQWEDCYHEDRGDSVFVLIPPEVPKGPLVEVAPMALARALRDHNQTSPPEQQARLRMAVHAGEVAFDDHGVTSTSLTTVFRLLDAAPLKRALANSPGTLALIVSRWIFDEIVRHSAVIDPATFRPVRLAVKETHDTAWIALPDHPYSSDPTVLDRTTTDPTRSDAALTDPAVVPRQLPAVPTPFVGRHDELDRLDTALNTSDQAATVVISAIGGAGGIGKTWLALAWANRHIDRFPDGQLFVDLRGFSPDSTPMPVAVAVRGFLDALGVDPSRIPVDPQAQTGLLRSLVTHKRMLIVLDNAVDAEQVVPLLPGGDSCTVVVTSRRTLTGLITRHGVHHLPLDILTDDEARALLTGRLGASRVAAEPDAVAELVGSCGGLPLALGIIAGRAHAHPRVPLAEFAADLRSLGLDVLDDDDPATGLPTVLSWSYRALTTQQQVVFGLLGIAPGPDIGLPAAASLTGLPPTQTARVLRGLQEASLLDRDKRGRYSMHDLIRRYATDTAHHQLPDDVQTAALRRVVDFYLHTAYAADRFLEPHRHPIRLDPPEPSCHPHLLPDVPAAMAWFDIEQPCLLAAQDTAITHHWHQAGWQLAWTLNTFHARRGHRHDRVALWQAALAAAGDVHHPIVHAVVHRYLGGAYALTGRHDEAILHLYQALTLAEHHHDHVNQALAHRALAFAWRRRGGNDRRALEHFTHALGIFRTLDDPVWEARMLNNVGWCAARLGDHDRARDYCQAALTLFGRHPDLSGEAFTWDSLGYIDHHAGHHEQAIHHYQQAVTLLRDLGDTYYVATSLDGLGHPHAALGQHDQARTVWREALELYRAQHRDDDAARVQRQLDDLDTHDHGDQPAPSTESAK